MIPKIVLLKFALLIAMGCLSQVVLAKQYLQAVARVSGESWILSQFLGEGGEAEVYLAEGQSPDNRGKKIAVKIFHESLFPVNYWSIRYPVLFDGSSGSDHFLPMDKPERMAVTASESDQPKQLWGVKSELASAQDLWDIRKELDLSRRSRRKGPDVYRERILALHRVAKDLVAGLDHLASHKLSHGDIKAANVLFLGERDIPVTAASLAAGTHRAVISDIGNVAAQPAVGTPYYRAPERKGILGLFGRSYPVSDYYSLGITLAEVIHSRRLSDDRVNLARELYHFANNLSEPDLKKKLGDVAQLLQAVDAADPQVRVANLKELLGSRNSLITADQVRRLGDAGEAVPNLVGLSQSTCGLVRWFQGTGAHRKR